MNGIDAFTKAYEDIPLLNRDELRPVRLQLEFLKAELLQQEARIESTIVVFGSARTPQGSPMYEDARSFARIVSEENQADGKREYVIVTGGGPGIMEAANRGASEAGAKSVALNIELPHEQRPNAWVTPELSFQFRYFALRKMHFMLRAKALVAFPGGFGTLDELFETLTLVQTRKVTPVPVILYGSEFWRRLIDWDYLVAQKVIAEEDLLLFEYADDPRSAWDKVAGFYRNGGATRR
jgi:uncharacterized protein (TIGR00730 family)